MAQQMTVRRQPSFEASRMRFLAAEKAVQAFNRKGPWPLPTRLLPRRRALDARLLKALAAFKPVLQEELKKLIDLECNLRAPCCD